MVLFAVFVALFGFGWWKAQRAGGGVADRVRYGVIHGILGALILFAVATFGDWFGWF